MIRMARILIAEDNHSLRQLMKIHLTRAGHAVFEASDGLAAMDMLEETPIDLIIADIMMPTMDGFQLIKELRDAHLEMPIIIVTSKDALDDKRTGFSIGADDYMTKPVDMEEMLIRVEALLRRCRIEASKYLTVGGTKLDREALAVRCADKEVILRQKEFLLLEKLLSSPKKIFTRQALMDDIWGYDSESEPRTVDAHIKQLRSKLKDIDDFRIETIRGLGYKAVVRK